MCDKLIFTRIKKENIFQEDFFDFKENNEIEFKTVREDHIAILYAPNGIGKTSLAKILSNKKDSDKFDKNCFFSTTYDHEKYTQDNNDLFYVIKDQISRNIIPGNTEDYLLGDNIKKEYQLKSFIDSEFEKLFKNYFPSKLKENFNIIKTKNELVNHIKDEKLRNYVSDFANNRSKGGKINCEEFLKKIKFVEEKK